MAYNRPCPRSAFTLLELMIAIGLGMLVVYIAMAGLRTASQTISIAQRLSMENSIIRSGMMIALHETDFWTSHDSPKNEPGDKGTYQLLRQKSSTGGGTHHQFQGLPFTPLASSTIYAKTGTHNNPGQTDAGYKEDATGWDPNAWGAHESRGWSWGNLVERVPVKHVWGMTDDPANPGARIPDLDKNGNQKNWPSNNFVSGDTNHAIKKRQIFGLYHLAGSTDNSSPHRWQQKQMEGLKRTLGSYGMLEYAPANAGLMIYSKRQDSHRWAVSPEWCYQSGGKDGYHLGDDNRTNGINFSHDIMQTTLGQVYALPSPRKGIANAISDGAIRPLNELRDISSRRWSTGISLDINSNDDTARSIKALLADVDISKAWLDHATGSAPETWPGLTVSSLRYVRTGAFVCLNRITWISPMTGKETEFTFTASGTTLRGARQQRTQDGSGWVDTFGTPKKNLDSYDK